MRPSLRFLIPALGSTALLAACTHAPSGDKPGQTPPISQSCNADPAQDLIGQKASADTGSRALELTRARTLRWGPPNAAFTMDYRQDRVNVIYDGAMSITQITCG